MVTQQVSIWADWRKEIGVREWISTSQHLIFIVAQVSDGVLRVRHERSHSPPPHAHL